MVVAHYQLTRLLHLVLLMVGTAQLRGNNQAIMKFRLRASFRDQLLEIQILFLSMRVTPKIQGSLPNTI